MNETRFHRDVIAGRFANRLSPRLSKNQHAHAIAWACQHGEPVSSNRNARFSISQSFHHSVSSAARTEAGNVNDSLISDAGSVMVFVPWPPEITSAEP